MSFDIIQGIINAIDTITNTEIKLSADEEELANPKEENEEIRTQINENT